MTEAARPSDKYRLALLAESIEQAEAERGGGGGLVIEGFGEPIGEVTACRDEPGGLVVDGRVYPGVAERIAAVEAAPLSPDEVAFELGPVALLEGVITWAYDQDLSLVATPEAWARVAFLAGEAIKVLRNAVDAAVRELAEVVPPDVVNVGDDNVGPFILHSGGDRQQWHNDEVRTKLIQRFAEERIAGCGECGSALPVKSIEAVVNAVFDVYGSGKWKTGRKPKEGAEATSGLRKLGIDPAEYSTWVPTGPTIEFVGVPKRRQRDAEPVIERRGPAARVLPQVALPAGASPDDEILGVEIVEDPGSVDGL